jgi:transposase-like protein
VYRAIDEFGQVIDVYVSQRRDLRAARRFFASALTAHGAPDEIVTDKAPALARAIHDLVPGALHDTAQYANNRIETDHGRLKARLRPMRGLKRDRTAKVIIRGRALMQNIRRGHYELGVDTRPHRRRLHRTRTHDLTDPSGQERFDAARSDSTQQSSRNYSRV